MCLDVSIDEGIDAFPGRPVDTHLQPLHLQEPPRPQAIHQHHIVPRTTRAVSATPAIRAVSSAGAGVGRGVADVDEIHHQELQREWKILGRVYL